MIPPRRTTVVTTTVHSQTPQPFGKPRFGVPTPQILRDLYARVIAELKVYPRAHGDRLTMRWQGAEDAFVVQEFKPARIPRHKPPRRLLLHAVCRVLAEKATNRGT
jgi:hypothetical protein